MIMTGEAGNHVNLPTGLLDLFNMPGLISRKRNDFESFWPQVRKPIWGINTTAFLYGAINQEDKTKFTENTRKFVSQ